MLKKILLWSAGTLGLIVGTLLAINFRDEALDADVAKVLARSEAMAPVSRNAYVYATGFFAPPNEDPYARGEKMLASYAAASRAGDSQAAQQTTDGQAGLSAELMKLPCDVANEDCVAQARVNPDALRVELQTLEAVAARCAALHDLPAWAETYVPDHVAAPLVNLRAVPICQRVSFARVALDLHGTQRKGALARVLRTMEFERRALGASVSLIPKMIAAAAFSRSTLFLSDIMRSEPQLAASNREAIASALRPLTAQERSIAPMLRSEFRLMARTVREFDRGVLDLSGVSGGDALKWLAMTPLHRVNGTLNRAWPAYGDLIEAERLPAGAFQDAAKKLRDSAVRLAVPSADWVYNPIGKLVLAIGVPQLSEYVGRMHDVDALVRLVAAQARIAPGFDEAAIHHALSDAALANPYTGKAMEFEPKARTLSFATQGRPTWRGKRWGGEGRVTVRLPASTPL